LGLAGIEFGRFCGDEDEMVNGRNLQLSVGMPWLRNHAIVVVFATRDKKLARQDA
jgi:hypothetical protein